jgi:dTDP-4-dehydrorhamnose 3,5-epimerase
VKVRATPLAGLYVLEDERAVDERGYFVRSFDRDDFARLGLVADFPQQSLSHNETSGTLRGLHFQQPPHAETKVVRCVQGAIYDVAVDLRTGSPTFGRWHAAELTARRGDSVYVPAGFAHGFQTLSDDTSVLYLISTPYQPDFSAGVRYDDADLAIGWPRPPRKVSARDRGLPTLSALEAGLSTTAG